jgi:hypothetical protein
VGLILSLSNDTVTGNFLYVLHRMNLIEIHKMQHCMPYAPMSIWGDTLYEVPGGAASSHCTIEIAE